MKKILVYPTLLILLAGCAITHEQPKGYVYDASRFEAIEPGVTPKAKVQQWLGSPSATSSFDGNSWYYISMTTASAAFRSTEVKDQQVIAIQFDDADIVSRMDYIGKDNAREVTIADDMTPTEGNEITVIEQLLGNLGKFNPKE